METLQCPECPLRFRFDSELEEHLRLEHPEFHAEALRSEDSIVAAVQKAHRRRHHRDPHDV
jgi:hypothetical protein